MTAKIFKPSAGTFGAITFKGLKEVQEKPTASVVTQRADGAQAITKMWAEGFGMGVSVTLEANENSNDFHIGDIAKLSFTDYAQADGAGPVAGGNKTINYPAAASTGYAMVVDVSMPYVFEGKPSVTISFGVCDGAGDRTLLREEVGG